ncbi:MAG: hypothetical protein M9899_01880 [Bdellovibrionaceae bacterium]|nr:hypothetical protein [Pseudobdellovibrionaceae bacterium]
MQKRTALIFILSTFALVLIGLGVWKNPALIGNTMNWNQRQVADDAKFFINLARENAKLQHADNVIVSHKSGTDREGRTFIQFGNFIEMSSGKTLCDLFDRMGLRLRSEGTAVNGYPVRIDFEMPCPGIDNKNPEFLLEIPLFNEELCSSVPDGVVRQLYKDVFVSLENYDKEFPVDWALEDVMFYDSQSRGHNLEYTGKAISDLLSAPIILSCPMY